MIGQLIGGRFELMEVAGAGGMGTVYRARDSGTGGSIALKVLKALATDVAALFEREVRVLRTLSHPGIVDFGANAYGARDCVDLS